MARARISTQLTLPGVTKRRPGPKPGPRPNVRHRTRDAHDHRNPVHVTLRAIEGLPSFRAEKLFPAFERAVRTTRRAGFRIAEFSVQDDHLHLIVEADDNDGLARGMKSFSVRANRLFNAASGRKRGRVWADHYHRRELTSAREVRDALVRCFASYKKRESVPSDAPEIDPCSSARWFEGWTSIRAQTDDAPPNERPRTFLLATAWQEHGLLDPAERASF